MKLIELSGKYGKGKYAQVDDQDYEELNKYKWFYHSYNGKNQYARRHIGAENRPIRNKRKLITIHRAIMQVDDPKIIIDHIDGNGLNNQRSNLRIASHSENMINTKIDRSKCSSKYNGVYKSISKNKYIYWQASCTKDKKTYTKSFKIEIEAALWYNEKAKELHGEYAKLNIITN